MEAMTFEMGLQLLLLAQLLYLIREVHTIKANMKLVKENCPLFKPPRHSFQQD